MNNNILFVYSQLHQKGTLTECEKILKAAFRRFRKKVSFSYAYMDYGCIENSLKNLSVKIKESDAVIWDCPSDILEDEINFLAEKLAIFAKAHFINGSAIVSPVSPRTLSCTKESFSSSMLITRNGVEKAAKIASELSLKRNRCIDICTDFDASSGGKLLCETFTDVLSSVPSLNINQLSYSELLWNSRKNIPHFDVLLTCENGAKIARINMCTLKNATAGYCVWYSDSLRIYKREYLPYEKLSNSAFASLLFSCAAAIINELKLKNVGEHLMMCTSRAFEQGAFFTNQDFKNNLLLLMEKPLRKRQEK